MAPRNNKEEEYTSKKSFFADSFPLQFTHLLTYFRLIFIRYKDHYLPFIFALLVGHICYHTHPVY